MQGVKNKLNFMISQSQLSEDRIRKFESALSVSTKHLEAALLEKEGLHRRIESVELQIINANRLREEMIEKCKALEAQIKSNVNKGKVMENREVEADEAMLKLEAKLKAARDTYQENSVRCEEAEERLQTLTTDYNQVHSIRVKLEKDACHLEQDLESMFVKVNSYEGFERSAAQEDCRRADELKLLEGYYRDTEERRQNAQINVMRLQRIVEQTEDDLETMQIRSRAAQVELQNIHSSVSD